MSPDFPHPDPPPGNDCLNRLRVVPPDPLQERLTRTFILPHLPSILGDFERLRRVIDAMVTHSLTARGVPLRNWQAPSTEEPGIRPGSSLPEWAAPFFRGLSTSSLASYPVGHCSLITGLAYRFLQQTPGMADTEGFSRLREFVAAGGIFRVIWGGLRRTYFQTAFQIGSHYVDIADDTVDIGKPFVTAAPLVQSGFHEIRSYREYVEIKRIYHQAELYTNTCLPGLFPYFPLLVRYPGEGPIVVDTNLYMARCNIAEGFRPVLDALEGGCLGRPLEEANRERIRTSLRSVGGHPADVDLLRFRPMDSHGMVRMLRDAASLAPAEHIRRLARAERLGLFLNHLWRRQSAGGEAPHSGRRF